MYGAAWPKPQLGTTVCCFNSSGPISCRKRVSISAIDCRRTQRVQQHTWPWLLWYLCCPVRIPARRSKRKEQETPTQQSATLSDGSSAMITIGTINAQPPKVPIMNLAIESTKREYVSGGCPAPCSDRLSLRSSSGQDRRFGRIFRSSSRIGSRSCTFSWSSCSGCHMVDLPRLAAQGMEIYFPGTGAVLWRSLVDH